MHRGKIPLSKPEDNDTQKGAHELRQKAANFPFLGSAEFDEYHAALGQVASAWNEFQDTLCQLFAALLPGSPAGITMAIWHSQQSDRSQRRMLSAVIEGDALGNFGLEKPEKAKEDVAWLINEANKLSGRRDEAIHAPCFLQITLEGEKRMTMVSSYYTGNPSAKILDEKNIVAEFYISDARATTLTAYSLRMINAIASKAYAWPSKRPSLSRDNSLQQTELNLQSSPKHT